MSNFYMDVSAMLSDYGVDILVWPANKLPNPDYQGGIRPPLKLSEQDAERRHEPVLPMSSVTSQMAQILAGGTELQGDLLWLSTDLFPINTIVEVPTQQGRFRVHNFSNYLDYSNLVVYELKGDDQHDYGESEESRGPTGTEGSISSSVHLGGSSQTGLRL